MDVDSRALKVITDWNCREYKNDGQKANDLHRLIISSLKEQDKLTRHLCAEKIAFMDEGGESDVILGNAIRKVMNARAL
jgi:hypothetical protein